MAMIVTHFLYNPVYFSNLYGLLFRIVNENFLDQLVILQKRLIKLYKYRFFIKYLVFFK